jgi:putative NADH-flavin reductase
LEHKSWRNIMNLAIFGASGRTGTLLVNAAIEGGHGVTAQVRDTARLNAASLAWNGVNVLEGEVVDPQAVNDAVHGADAVLVALGAPPRATDRVLERGTRAIIDAMKTHSVERLVVLTSFAIADGPSLTGPIGRALLGLSSRLTRPLWRDKEAQEAAVMASELDWTLVRPITLTNGPATGDYVAEEAPKIRLSSRISRADVAAFMLAEATVPRWSGRAVRLVAG